MAMGNTDWVKSLQRIQPDSGNGAQRAGMPGMGGGNIPYAPGATQLTPPSAQVPTQTNAPQQQGFGGPGGANAMGTPPGPQGQPGGPGMGQTPDIQRVIMVANYLMERLKHQIASGQERRV